jgi:hypothetical protein
MNNNFSVKLLNSGFNSFSLAIGLLELFEQLPEDALNLIDAK